MEHNLFQKLYWTAITLCMSITVVYFLKAFFSTRKEDETESDKDFEVNMGRAASYLMAAFIVSIIAVIVEIWVH